MIFTSSAFAACELFEDFDFGGQAGVVQESEYLQFAAAGDQASQINEIRRTLNDSSWKDKISSVRLSANCQAVFFMTPGKGEGHCPVRTTTPRFDAKLNDNTQGVVCECKG